MKRSEKAAFENYVDGYKAEKVDGGWHITNIKTKPDPSLLCECGRRW